MREAIVCESYDELLESDVVLHEFGNILESIDYTTAYKSKAEDDVLNLFRGRQFWEHGTKVYMYSVKRTLPENKIEERRIITKFKDGIPKLFSNYYYVVSWSDVREDYLNCLIQLRKVFCGC